MQAFFLKNPKTAAHDLLTYGNEHALGRAYMRICKRM